MTYNEEFSQMVSNHIWDLTSQEDRLFDDMCTSAEINNRNRPYMESSSYGVKISTWFIPTLEDLKNCLVLNNDPGYPYMITTAEDVKKAATIVIEKEGLSSKTLIASTATIIPLVIEWIIQAITAYQNECNAMGEQVGSLMRVACVYK